MVYLINASLSSGIFPNILKTSKMTLTHKKDSKLKYLNHRPISILWNIDKILKRVMYNKLYAFLKKYIFTFPNLGSDKNIQPTMY